MWGQGGIGCPCTPMGKCLAPNLCHMRIVSVILGSFDCLFSLSLGQHPTKAQAHVHVQSVRSGLLRGQMASPGVQEGSSPNPSFSCPLCTVSRRYICDNPSGRNMHAGATCKSPWGWTGSGGQHHGTSLGLPGTCPHLSPFISPSDPWASTSQMRWWAFLTPASGSVF